MFCPIEEGMGTYGFIYFGVKIFLLVWIIAVPVIVTSRLDRIAKILEEIKDGK